MTRKVWIVALVVAVAAGGAYVLTHHRAKSPDAADGAPSPGGPGGGGGRGGRMGPPPTVGVAPVTVADMPVYLDGLGTIQAYNTVTVHTRVDGQLMKVAFTEGQFVKAGDLLAKLDDRLYQAAYDQAVAKLAQDQATLDNARLDLERYRALASEKFGTQQQYDTQKSTVAQDEATVKYDKAAVATARTNLDYCTITAPIDGRIGLRQVDIGNIAHASDSSGLVVITQLNPISVIFTLPQQNLTAINGPLNQGQTLTALAVSTDGRVLDHGTLTTVDNQIDTSTGTLKLKAAFPNKDLTLWPGGFVNVRLLVDTRRHITVVPLTAIQHGPKGTYVYVVKDDNTVDPRPVTVAFSEGQQSAVTDGVAVGERVVVNGQDRLQAGATIQIAGAAPADAAPGAAAPPADGQPKRHHKDKGGAAPVGAGRNAGSPQ